MLCVAFGVASAHADEVAGTDVADGDLAGRIEALSEAGRCDEVVAALGAAGDTWRDDAAMRLAMGRCDVQMQRWESARENLLAARRLDPSLTEVDLYLAIAEFHAGNRAEASAAIGRAREAADRGEDLLAEQHCHDVANRLEQNAGAVGDADLQVEAARCDIRFERYDQALAHLRAARAADPGRRDLDLWDGVVRFHQGDFEAALALFARAEVADNDSRALLLLYRGRALIDQARKLEALEVIDRHRRRPLRVVEPVDFFDAVNPWPQDVLRGRAKQDLERVGQYDESGRLADEVNSALAEVDEPRGPWIAGAIEFHYDDTVVLLGSGADTPDEISKSNGFEFDPAIYVEGGGGLFRVGRWSGGLLGSFFGTFPDESNELDTVYPSISAYVDRHIDERMTARVRYDFGYTWVNGDDFAMTNEIDLLLHNRSERWGEATVWTRLYYDIFYDDQRDFPATDGVVPGICDSTLLPAPFPASAPSCSSNPGVPGKAPLGGSRRDRTGWGFLFGGRLRKSFDWNHTEVRGGYTYEHYIPDGAEFHNQSHGVDIGVNTALPFGFAFDFWTKFTYQGFRNISAYPEPATVLPNLVWTNKNIRRHERAWEVAVEIERHVLENIKFWVEYRYLNNDANYASFDYDRNVVGVGVSAILY